MNMLLNGVLFFFLLFTGVISDADLEDSDTIVVESEEKLQQPRRIPKRIRPHWASRQVKGTFRDSSNYDDYQWDNQFVAQTLAPYGNTPPWNYGNEGSLSTPSSQENYGNEEGYGNQQGFGNQVNEYGNQGMIFCFFHALNKIGRKKKSMNHTNSQLP